jgi:hypothetical protein
MIYPIPKEVTIGGYEVKLNTNLSDTDKAFAAAVYPKQEKDSRRIEIGAHPLEADIGKYYEVDLYDFQVVEPGVYLIGTGGQTDVEMVLTGPESKTDKRGYDNDSGDLHNALIKIHLEPGKYYVHIRHFNPLGTGRYSLSVRKS